MPPITPATLDVYHFWGFNMKRKHVIKLTLLLLCVSSCYHRHIPAHSPDYVNYNCPYVFSDGAVMCVSIDAKNMDLVLDISFK